MSKPEGRPLTSQELLSRTNHPFDIDENGKPVGSWWARLFRNPKGFCQHATGLDDPAHLSHEINHSKSFDGK